MKKIIPSLLVLLVMLSGCQSTGKNGKPLTPVEISQQREATIKMAKTGLDALIKQNPAVKKDIDAAAGYAVFSTTNVNVVLIVVAKGVGVLYDKHRKEPIFMDSLKTGEGLGAGYQDQYQVAIFKTPNSVDQFLLTSIVAKKAA